MKNKGFTLVELLAVIVILGIIIAVAVPNIIMSSKKSKNQMYDTKVNMIEKAAELYGNDNFDEVNDNNKIVSLSTLIEKNYLKKDDNNCSGKDCIKDPRTNEGIADQNVCICTINKSVVAEFIGTKNSCAQTICDPNNVDNPITPDPTNSIATVNCAAGTFKTQQNSYYNSTDSCIACATGSYSAAGASACIACQGRTTSGIGKSSCDATCPNATGVSTWATATWTSNSVSNLCKVSTCNNSSGYFISGNACIKITAANVSYTTTNNSSITNVEQALSDLYSKFE